MTSFSRIPPFPAHSHRRTGPRQAPIGFPPPEFPTTRRSLLSDAFAFRAVYNRCMSSVDTQGILNVARAKRATDVHIVAGSPVLLRVEGELMPITKDALPGRLAKEL